MHKALDCEIRGISPFMMHNGHLADPLNPYTKRLKSLTSKKKKTDDDHQAIADAEWEGGLYLDEDDRVIVPGENIEAAMIEGGKKDRIYDAFKAGLYCDGSWPLTYDGPKDLAKLKADLRFRDTRGVRVQQNRVMRTRPIFVGWSLKFTLHYLPDLLDEQQVLDTLAKVGRIIGIGEYTPKYGRFEVVSHGKAGKSKAAA